MMELLSISPIDGRYKKKTIDFQNYFSEYALFKYRLYVEISWLKFIIKEKIVDEKLSNSDITKINNITVIIIKSTL